jgi:hypothetical protein
MLALGEMKWQEKLDIYWPGGSSRVVELSAHYLKFKGLNLPYREKENAGKKLCISCPGMILGQ